MQGKSKDWNYIKRCRTLVQEIDRVPGNSAYPVYGDCRTAGRNRSYDQPNEGSEDTEFHYFRNLRNATVPDSLFCFQCFYALSGITLFIYVSRGGSGQYAGPECRGACEKAYEGTLEAVYSALSFVYCDRRKQCGRGHRCLPAGT